MRDEKNEGLKRSEEKPVEVLTDDVIEEIEIEDLTVDGICGVY
jgi:hypothetical protein